MKPITAPIAAEVRTDVKSEAAMIQEAKHALSTCSWKLGEIASQWSSTHAKGRTDADFGAMVGMSGDQVYQRRRVYDRFGSQTDIYRNLSWSHFYAALTWDDADACLQWASENYATVAEMKSWRSVQHGEDETPNRYISENQPSSGSGESGVTSDPFGSSDPFGEGEGKEGGKETDGKEPAEEESTRPPGSGREASGGKPPKSKAEQFADQKAKTIKTAEALQRAIGDLNALKPIREKDAIVKATCRVIETVKAYK